MSNTGPTSNTDQVSMDDILTSIREAIGNNQEAHKKSSSSHSKNPSTPRDEAASDVLELTNPIGEPSADRIKDKRFLNPPPDALLSQNVFSKAAYAFEALSEAVKTKEILEEHQGAGGQRVDDLMKEIMRPYIKTWLDQNLPPIVERLVQKEIVKLTQSTVTPSS